MWKPFLLSVGIYLCILGGECLILERAVMAREAPKVHQQDSGIFGPTAIQVTKKKEIVPTEWAPWSLLSVGAVVIMYGLSVNQHRE
jgi:hypothetical protein